MGYYGLDTYSRLTNISTSQIRAWGYPSFFVRYGDSGNMNNPVAELRNAWYWGARHLGLVWPSYSSQTTGDYSTGYNQGRTFSSNALWFWNQVGPLLLSARGTLFLYLDQEASQTTSPSYWQGYVTAVDSFQWPGGSYPLFATLYCNPYAPQPNCTLSPKPWAIWSSEPEPCGWCKPFGKEPSGGRPYTCGGYPPVTMWQYQEDVACVECNNYSTPVDADYSGQYNSSSLGDAVANMYQLTSSP
jgi:hypothetical protein